MAKQISIPQTVYLPLDLNATLEQVSYDTGKPKSYLMACAVAEYLGKPTKTLNDIIGEL